jgi:hypothetical protein
MQLEKGKISSLRFRLTGVARSRWEGTYSGTKGTTAAGPGCAGGNCTCAPANADSSDYSDVYKEFLSDFYIAQVCPLKTKTDWNRRAVFKLLGVGFIGTFLCGNFSSQDLGYGECDPMYNAINCILAHLQGVTKSF